MRSDFSMRMVETFVDVVIVFDVTDDRDPMIEIR